MKLEVEEKSQVNINVLRDREKSKCEFEIFIEKVDEEIANSMWDSKPEDLATSSIQKLENRSDDFDKIYSGLVGAFSGEVTDFQEKRA